MRFFHLSDLHLGIKLYSLTPLFSRGIFTIVPCRLSKRLRCLTTS